jgi:hypothetical protein
MRTVAQDQRRKEEVLVEKESNLGMARFTLEMTRDIVEDAEGKFEKAVNML